MSTRHIKASAVISAPPSKVYQVLADYRQHHPRIVPPKYFKKLEVLQGGAGAGTRTRLTARILGRTMIAEHVVSEPEPGRVLVETDVTGTTVTTFTVEPSAAGAASKLTIVTDFRVRDGLLGKIEGAIIAMIFPKIYQEELTNIERYVRSI